MPKIAITGGMMLIDSNDLPVISGRRVWLAAAGYAQVRQGRKCFYLHRLLIGAQPGEYVDHANGDILDNRRRNLRICTNQENIRNRHGPTKGNSCGYRGVCFERGWIARINIGHRTLFLGRFSSAQKAARAYDKAALYHFGEFAGRLNIPAIAS